MNQSTQDTASNNITVKSNYIYFIIEGTLFFIALAFITQEGLIPVFIDKYTGSVALVGTAVTIRMMFKELPKIIFGRKLNSIANMPRFTAILMLITRPLILFMIPILALVKNPHIVVWGFLLIYMLFWSGQSIIGVTWSDIFGRTVEGKLRGKIHGYQQVFGGIGGLVAGGIVKFLLDSQSLKDTTVYMIIFGLSGLLMLGSGVMLLFVQDVERPKIKAPESLKVYMRRMPTYLKEHKKFRRVSYTMMFSKVILLGNPFMILIAKNVVGVSNSYITTLIYVQIAGTLIGGLLWGNMSHKLGNLKVIITSNIMIMLSAVFVCVSILYSGSTIAVMLVTISVVLGGISASCWLGYVNYTLDIAGEGERIDMMVIQSVMALPISILGYLVGVVAQQWGYLVVFMSIAIIAVFALKASFEIEK